jgi:phage-related protein
MMLLVLCEANRLDRAHSKADLKEFPERVQRSVGFALWGVQGGETPPSSKVLKGLEAQKFERL